MKRKGLIIATAMALTILTGCKANAEVTVTPQDEGHELSDMELERYMIVAHDIEEKTAMNLVGQEDMTQLIIIDDMTWNPEKYDSKRVRISGMSRKFTDDGSGRPFYMCLVSYADDVEPMGLEYVLAEGDYPADGEMITVEGTFMYYTKERDGATYELQQIREARFVDPNAPFIE